MGNAHSQTNTYSNLPRGRLQLVVRGSDFLLELLDLVPLLAVASSFPRLFGGDVQKQDEVWGWKGSEGKQVSFRIINKHQQHDDKPDLEAPFQDLGTISGQGPWRVKRRHPNRNSGPQSTCSPWRALAASCC